MKEAPLEAARQFIEKHFPHCEGAVLAGSIIRGEATAHSDLDIVVFDSSLKASYRESLVEFGWPIELFAHNLESYRMFFEMDYWDATATMQRMVSEGKIIVDKGILTSIKQEAVQQLETGPEVWSEKTIAAKRYFLTDILDDFIGSENMAEDYFSAGQLAQQLHEFVLRTNGLWIGKGKWIVRALKKYDPAFAEQFVEAFESFYRTGEKTKIISLTDFVLESYGGRLFAGFSIGKELI